MKQRTEDTEPLHMRFQKSLIARIDRLRRKSGLTRTATVQWLVRRGLEAMRDSEAARKTDTQQVVQRPQNQ